MHPGTCRFSHFLWLDESFCLKRTKQRAWPPTSWCFYHWWCTSLAWTCLVLFWQNMLINMKIEIFAFKHTHCLLALELWFCFITHPTINRPAARLVLLLFLLCPVESQLPVMNPCLKCCPEWWLQLLRSAQWIFHPFGDVNCLWMGLHLCELFSFLCHKNSLLLRWLSLATGVT